MEQNSEIVIYQTTENETRIQTRLQDETVWLTQEQMALLFGKGRSTIAEHIGNIFKEGELNEKEVCRNFRHTNQRFCGVYYTCLQHFFGDKIMKRILSNTKNLSIFLFIRYLL